jgi:hypothetical protein
MSERFNAGKPKDEPLETSSQLSGKIMTGKSDIIRYRKIVLGINNGCALLQITLVDKAYSHYKILM